MVFVSMLLLVLDGYFMLLLQPKKLAAITDAVPKPAAMFLVSGPNAAKSATLQRSNLTEVHDRIALWIKAWKICRGYVLMN